MLHVNDDTSMKDVLKNLEKHWNYEKQKWIITKLPAQSASQKLLGKKAAKRLGDKI